jgi:hypothetical protein
MSNIVTKQIRSQNRVIMFLLVIILILASECAAQTHADSVGVFKVLRLYENFVSRMEADSIVSLFAENGELVKSHSESIVGPAAIRAFLLSFSAYHVLSYKMESDTLIFKNGYALQSGVYRQQVRIPEGDTVKVGGRFHIEWQRTQNDNWQIRRISTTPTTK